MEAIMETRYNTKYTSNRGESAFSFRDRGNSSDIDCSSLIREQRQIMSLNFSMSKENKHKLEQSLDRVVRTLTCKRRPCTSRKSPR